MKRIAVVLIALFATLAISANAPSSSRFSKDLIDRRDGQGPGLIEIAGDLWKQGKWEYEYGKASREPVEASFYVAGKDASSSGDR